MAQPRAVVFDLDGTLTDTFSLSLKATQHVLRQFMGHELPDAELIPLYGVPLVEIMDRFVPGQADAMIATFEEFYLLRQEELVRPFAGVPAALRTLRERGYPLAILSNKRKEPGLRELQICGLEEYFGSVLFLEDLVVPKPAAEALQQSATLLGVDVREVLYVGDSSLDIQCAQNAGATSAAALWADWDRERILAQGPDHLLASVEDLLALCPPRPTPPRRAGAVWNVTEVKP